MDIVETAFEGCATTIAHGSARRRSNESDAISAAAAAVFFFLFPARIEKVPLLPAVFFQLLKSKLQRARARPVRSTLRKSDYSPAAAFINADRAANGHLESVFRQKISSPALLLLEKHAAHLRPLILQSEVIMTRRKPGGNSKISPLHCDPP